MLNVLIISEDSFFMNRMEASLRSTSEYNCHYVDSSDEAMTLISDVRIDIAILSMTMPVMSGEELADYILDTNRSARFIFIYSEEYIESAVDLFNHFDGSMIYERKTANPEDIKQSINDMCNDYLREIKLKDEIDAYREREKTYKHTMDEMTKVLNARIECYHDVSVVFAKSIQCLNLDLSDDDQSKINDFYLNGLNKYIQDFLIEELSFETFIEELQNNLNNTELMKHYQFVNVLSGPIENPLIASRICFATYYISHIFADCFEKYRVKLELKENDVVYRLDALADSRLANANLEMVNRMLNVANAALGKIGQKIEMGEKDGIIQIRVYFVKNTDATIATKGTAS